MTRIIGKYCRTESNLDMTPNNRSYSNKFFNICTYANSLEESAALFPTYYRGPHAERRDRGECLPKPMHMFE